MSLSTREFVPLTASTHPTRHARSNSMMLRSLTYFGARGGTIGPINREPIWNTGPRRRHAFLG